MNFIRGFIIFILGCIIFILGCIVAFIVLFGSCFSLISYSSTNGEILGFALFCLTVTISFIIGVFPIRFLVAGIKDIPLLERRILKKKWLDFALINFVVFILAIIIMATTKQPVLQYLWYYILFLVFFALAEIFYCGVEVRGRDE